MAAARTFVTSPYRPAREAASGSPRLVFIDVRNDHPAMTESLGGPTLGEAETETGERTFFIADIRGYTRFTRERGDASAARLAQLFAALVGDAVEGRGGRVVEVRGDEVMAVFAAPAHAIRAALELVALCEEEKSEDLPLLAGVGIETGPAVAVGDGFRGTALNRAARLCSTAGAGEVLLAETLVARIAAVDDLVFTPHGTAELKGFDAPIKLAAARPARRLTPAIEPPAEHDAAMPVELETDPPLVGRARELAWLRGAWRRARRGSGSVVFASGPAGIGKTRLAAEIAATAVRSGGRIVYIGAGGTAAALAQSALADAAQAAVATLVVLDDLDAIGEALVSTLADSALTTRPVLVLGLAREPERILGLAQLLDEGGRLGGGHRALGPLDASAMRDIADLYAGAYVDEVPLEEIGRASGGVPSRVHELLDDWAGREASRRLAAAAEWLAAERLDRSADLDFANSVIGRKLARLYSPEHGETPALGVCPYKGLASFEGTDAPFFFGRERLVGELAARTVGVGLLAVVGASGSGKSSALAAGLVPSLEAGLLPGSERWSFVQLRPGAHPSRELAAALDRAPQSARQVVVIDQFEELFTICADESERGAFVERLVSLASEPEQFAVVIGLRGDFYGHCAAYPEFARLVAANQVLVGPMTGDDLKRAIELPGRRAGVRVEAALVDTLVAEVGEEPGALPLLSTALVELWFDQSDGRLRLTSHEQLGGMRGAVARLAESGYENLDDAQRQAAQRLFLRLITVGEEGVATRRRVPRAELDLADDAVLASVVERLTEDRLLTAHETSVEIAHEALLREWPRLEAWLAEDGQGRELREHLTQSAKRWDEVGREPAELYRGPRLAATLDWAATRGAELNQLEREFLEESRRQSELEAERQRRQNRRLRFALAGAGVLLAAAIVAGVLALVQRGQARRAATSAVAQSLGAQGVSEPRIDLAMLLARASVALDPTIRTRSDLLTTLLRVPTALRTYHWNANRNSGVAVSPDGSTVAIDDNDGDTTVESAATGATIGKVSADTLGFGPDGSLLTAPGNAVAGRPGVIKVRDARSASLKVLRIIRLPKGLRGSNVTVGSPTTARGRLGVELTTAQPSPLGPQTTAVHVAQYEYSTGRAVAPTLSLPKDAGAIAYLDGNRRLIYLTGDATTVLDARTGRRIRSYPIGGDAFAVSNDGRTLAVASGPAVRFVDLQTGKVTVGIGAAIDGTDRLAFTPDGATLATSGEDGKTLLWDIQSHTVRDTFAGHSGPIHAQTISADGSTLYTGSFDTNVLGWDLTGRRSFPPSFQAIETDPSVQAWTLAISPDSHTIAVGSTTGNVALWDAKTLREERTFAAVPGFVSAVAFGDNGHELLVSGDKPPATSWLRVWRLGAHSRLMRSISVRGFVTWTAWSSDGRTFAATAAASLNDSQHGFVREWDASTGRSLGAMAVKDGFPTYVAFAPRGTTVAISGYNFGADILDPAKGTVESRIPRIGLYTFSANFSPDGKALATTDWDGTLDLWDPATGEQLGAAIPDPDKGVGTSVAWSPDGKTLALTDQSETLRLFDVATRREIGPPFQLGASQANTNLYAEYTPDGRSVVVSDDTGKTWVVPVTLSAWEATACRIANRNLSRAEWNEFLPGRSYRRFCP
jgi:WD40 repeat protein/class 3 adenylate cyclase